MWLENDRTNALILEVKPQPPGRLHGEKIVLLAMPGSYFSDVQYRQVLVVPQLLTRLQFLQELGLVKECGLYGVMRCLIQVGFAPWEQQDSHTRLIAHASFLQIWVDGRDPGACQEHLNEDDSGFEEDDEQSLLQTVWHGVETLGIAQLPPPGNPVWFDSRVNVSEGGNQFCCRDPQCTNDFWLGLVQEASCCDNPFVQAFLKLELVQTLEEREEVSQVIDKNEDEEAQSEDSGVLMRCLEGEHLLPCVEDTDEVHGELPTKVISLVDTLGDIYAPFVDDRTQNGPYEYGVDCSVVIQAMDWFNHHSCIPLFPQDIGWKPCTVPWVDLPRWQGECPHELHFYLDGSAVEHRAGATVVLWALTSEWQWAGCLAHQLEVGRNAFEAEVVAHMLTAKWLHDLWRTQGRHWAWTPRVVCHYDSTSAAGSALGWCQARDPLTMKARGLHHLLKHGHGIEIEASHVYGHQGDPGNEAADIMAKCAATHSMAQPFWQGFCSEDTLPSLFVQWFWMLARHDLRRFWCAGCLQPPIPMNEEDAEVVQKLKSWQTNMRSAEPVQLQLRAVSCNVLTLSQRYVSAHAATASFLDQCHDKGYAIVALQETRLKRLRFGHPEYVTVAHPCHKGQGGVLLALHRKLFRVHGEGEAKEALAEKHISVVASTHELLIARVWYGSLDLLVIVAHAPHTGHSPKEVEAFWSSIRSALPPYLQDTDMIVLTDANARLGTRISSAVHGHYAEEENDNGACFHEFLLAQHLWVPSTFSEFHVGPGHTWTHPAGKQSRIDFIAVPAGWHFTSMVSWTDFQLQAHGHLHDHHAVSVSVEFECHLPGNRACVQVKRPMPLQPVGTNAEARMQMTWATGYMLPIDWRLDVHQHAQELATRFSEGVHHVIPRRQPFHRKPHFSEETRAVIRHKAELRGQLLHLQHGRRLLGLEAIFLAWRAHCRGGNLNLQPYQCIDWHLARLWVSLSLTFRQVRNRATALQRQDTRAFFDTLKEEWKTCDQPARVKELWTLVKRHLPKNRARQQARPAVQQESLRDQWRPHLEKLEAGAHERLENLYQELLTEDTQVASNRMMCKLEEIPSLVRVENSLRCTRPGKAPGPDGLPSEWIHAGADSLAPWVFDLVLKMHLTAKEPVQWKGGVLHMLPKVPMPVSAEQYRGIMLLGVFVRRVHALLRPQVMAWADIDRPPGQLGGFAHQECAFGSLYVQTFMRRAYHRGVPAAVIFVDLRAAFHSVVREIVLGSKLGDDKDRCILEEALLREGFVPDIVEKLVKAPGLLPDCMLTNLLRELHSRTWATLNGEAVRTTRGTRPGSPLADALFHCLMGPVVADLEKTTSARVQQQQMRQQCATRGAQIVWADDLAVPVLASTNDELLREVGSIFLEVEFAFAQRGMTLNMSKGKSEALLTPAGMGAKQMREQLRLQPRLELESFCLGPGQRALMLGAQYKHLGTTLSAGGLLGQEIHRRIGQAWTAFRSMSRQLFINSALKEATRLFLLEALVFTKLYYGCGSWPLLRAQDMRRLQVCQGNMLRRTLRQNKVEGNKVMTDVEILVKAGCVPVRVRLAQHRLLLAARLTRHGPQFVLQELQEEATELTDGWHAGLAEDLQWLASAMDLSTWGTTPEELQLHWEQGRPGWKRMVKQAGMKHVVLLPRMCGRALVRGGEEDTLLDLLHQAQFRCECGAFFGNSKALRLHRIQKHEWRNPEHGRIHGATCPVCLCHYWTVNRLQLHLRYVSRQGRPNRCGAWVRMFARFEAERDDLPADNFVALPGATRKDAIALVGPHVLGADENDLDYAEQEFMQLRRDLLSRGVSFAVDDDSKAALFRTFASQCSERLTLEDMQHFWDDFPIGEWLGAFFIWCMHADLQGEDLEWWRHVISGWDDGPNLLQAHDLAVHVHRLRELQDAIPERPAYMGPSTAVDPMQSGHLPPLPKVWRDGVPLAVHSLSLRVLGTLT